MVGERRAQHAHAQIGAGNQEIFEPSPLQEIVFFIRQAVMNSVRQDGYGEQEDAYRHAHPHNRFFQREHAKLRECFRKQRQQDQYPKASQIVAVHARFRILI